MISWYNGLFIRCQTITWTNADLVLIVPQIANFGEFRLRNNKKQSFK